MSGKQCRNLKKDRATGKYWERQFCLLAKQQGFMFTPMQIGRAESALAYKGNGKRWNTFTLPDVTVWTAPGQHHEIKHKEPNRHKSYGLERYRLDALLSFAEETDQDVMYTIHDHRLAGGRDVKENDISHWRTVSVTTLDGAWTWNGPGYSWVNGQKKRVEMCYWPARMWQALSDYWCTTVTEIPQELDKRSAVSNTEHEAYWERVLTMNEPTWY